MNLQSYYFILPFSEKAIQVSNIRGIQFLMLPDKSNNSGNNDDGVVRQGVKRVGIPMTTSKQVAMDYARQMALESREVPVICRVIAFVELPKNVTFVEKYFTAEGEIVSQEPNAS